MTGTSILSYLFLIPWMRKNIWQVYMLIIFASYLTFIFIVAILKTEDDMTALLSGLSPSRLRAP